MSTWLKLRRGIGATIGTRSLKTQTGTELRRQNSTCIISHSVSSLIRGGFFRKGKLEGSQFKPEDELDNQISSSMRMSNMQRGAPFELSEAAFARLLQHLNAMTPLLKA